MQHLQEGILKDNVGDARSLISEINRRDLDGRLLGGSSGRKRRECRSAESDREEAQEGEAAKSRRVAANAISTGYNGTFNKTCRASALS